MKTLSFHPHGEVSIPLPLVFFLLFLAVPTHSPITRNHCRLSLAPQTDGYLVLPTPSFTSSVSIQTPSLPGLCLLQTPQQPTWPLVISGAQL